MKLKELVAFVCPHQRNKKGIIEVVNSMSRKMIMEFVADNEQLLDNDALFPLDVIMGKRVATLEMAIRGAIEDALMKEFKTE